MRAKVRRLQEQVAKRKMLTDVQKADVVIMNPTHYAVALSYDREKGGAPLLWRKEQILWPCTSKRLPKAHGVEVFQAAPLARSIFYSTEVGKEIPQGLYLAVAKVLAYVYQLKAHRRGKGKRPKAPDHFSFPEDLKR